MKNKKNNQTITQNNNDYKNMQKENKNEENIFSLVKNEQKNQVIISNINEDEQEEKEYNCDDYNSLENKENVEDYNSKSKQKYKDPTPTSKEVNELAPRQKKNYIKGNIDKINDVSKKPTNKEQENVIHKNFGKVPD